MYVQILCMYVCMYICMYIYMYMFIKLFLGTEVDSKLGAALCVCIYTGLFEMIVGVLTTCHTQYT